ncbi:Serine/threonine-protein phosphatase 7 long form-like protein [Bienertia sinuspersici]
MGIEIPGVAAEHTLGGIKLTKTRELLGKKGNVDDVASGYLVTLLGSTLITDKTVDRTSTLLFPLTSDLVGVKTYSWSSATLTHLYQELCKASRAECAQLTSPSTLLEVIWMPCGSNVADNFSMSLYQVVYAIILQLNRTCLTVLYGEGMMSFWGDPSSDL